MTKRTYGWLLEQLVDNGGTEVLIARAVVREDNSDHPINPRSEPESTIWDAPKHAEGRLFGGLEIKGFKRHDDANCIWHSLSYRDVFSIDLREAKAMVKTLDRAHKRLAATEAEEPGDRLHAVGSALNFTFCVVRSVKDNGSGAWGYAGSGWNWMSLNSGRNYFRQMIHEMENKEAA